MEQQHYCVGLHNYCEETVHVVCLWFVANYTCNLVWHSFYIDVFRFKTGYYGIQNSYFLFFPVLFNRQHTVK